MVDFFAKEILFVTQLHVENNYMSGNRVEKTRSVQMYISVGEAANYFGVSIKSLRRWEKKGILEADHRTVGGHRRYALATIVHIQQQLVTRTWYKKKDTLLKANEPQQRTRQKTKDDINQQIPKRAIVYSRMSKRIQKEDLERQIQTLQDQALKDGYTVIRAYKDIASGLNDRRMGSKRAVRMCLQSNIVQRVYIMFRDQLARFGTRLLESIFNWSGVELVVVGVLLEQEGDNGKNKKSFLDEFIQVFLGIVTSFAGTFYRIIWFLVL